MNANPASLVADPAAARLRLHAALLRADSATRVLEAWCGGPVRVERVAGDTPAADPDRARRLGVGMHEPVGYRHVRLIGGGCVLSVAENWFVPSRLTEAMRRDLEGDIPFGRVVAALALRRRTLSAVLCAPGEAVAMIHHAVLVRAEGEAIAEVLERYAWP